MTRSFGLFVAAVGFTLSLASAQAQELRTAVDGTFAPHAFPDLATGGIQGFNVDLAKAVGEKLKRPLKIDSAQFSGLLPAMQAGTYDFIAAPVTATRERAESMLFTEGYLNTDFIFVVGRNEAVATKLEDFKGKTVTVNKGSAYDSWARGLEAQIGWKVESFGTQTDAVQAVIAGRASANITGNTVGAWAIKQNPALKASYLHSTGLVWAMAVRKGNEPMRASLDNAIECLKQDGTIAKLHEKWFGSAPAAGSAAVTVFPGAGVPGLPGHDATPRAPTCG
jgi:polar amino acid transport system substrate-binding protein